MRRKLITVLFFAGLVTTTWAVLGADGGRVEANPEGTVRAPAGIPAVLPP